MKIVLYSGGGPRENKVLDKELLRLLKSDEPTITYIPITVNEHPRYFREFKRYYSKYGKFRFLYFALDKEFTKEQVEDTFKSDLIYLSGGNTYELLKNLRKSGLASRFKTYVRQGGVLAGQSAGAILMTPSIGLAAIPSATRDDNEVGIKNPRALGLLNFEFSPHYDGCPEADEELMNYSRTKSYPILCAEDGGGIVIENNKIKLVGSIVKFEKGQKAYLKTKSFRQ